MTKMILDVNATDDIPVQYVNGTNEAKCSSLNLFSFQDFLSNAKQIILMQEKSHTK